VSQSVRRQMAQPFNNSHRRFGITLMKFAFANFRKNKPGLHYVFENLPHGRPRHLRRESQIHAAGDGSQTPLPVRGQLLYQVAGLGGTVSVLGVHPLMHEFGPQVALRHFLEDFRRAFEIHVLLVTEKL